MIKKFLKKVQEFFIRSNTETHAQSIGKSLVKNKLTLAVAESCTGGLVSSKLTDVSGSSNYIKLNFVTYSNNSKVQILGINKKLIENYGAVSKQTALSMAEGVRMVSGCDIGLGITGIAGPTGGSINKPVGLVFIAVCNRYVSRVIKLKIPSHFSRIEIKNKASQQAIVFLEEFINENY